MLKEKLMEELKQAMKNKDTIKKNTVQMVRAAILQIEKDKGIEVGDDKILEIIAKEVKTKKVHNKKKLIIKKISNIFNAIGNGVAKRDRLDAPSIK